jgi:TetR/AcrR family transcriptional repressor of mexJK operon
MRTKSKKKLEIIKTAEKRFVRHGLKKTTLDEVARDLRMSKSTLYHYFESKEDIYYQTLDNQFSEYIAEVKAIFSEENIQPDQIIRKYFELRKSFSQSYKLLTQLVLFALNDTTTQPENDLLIKYHKVEVKIIEEFIKALFPGVGTEVVKKKTENFVFLLYSSTLLTGFLTKINIDIPDENSIQSLLSQI